MKNTGKSSQNNQDSNDTLIYLFLFVLIVSVVAIFVHFAVNGWSSNPQAPEIDYTELGERLAKPTAKEVSQLLEENKKRETTIQRGLNSVNKKLSSGEKEAIRQELNDSKSSLADIIKKIDLTKFSPEELAAIYWQLYEQGKTLVKLKSKIASGRTYQELKKQWEITQPNWQISAGELVEINTWLKKLIPTWYDQFMDNKLTARDGTRKWWYLKPVLINGREASEDSPADIDFFKKVQQTGKGAVDLRQPVKIDFQGYGGFLTTKDQQETNEGKTTLGVTYSDTPEGLSWTKERGGVEIPDTKSEFWFFPENRRSIIIRLKKELFFNREGYDEWITKVYQKDKQWGRGYFDISWDELIETIAHELAHAVISSLRPHYEGERKGGHGQLHDDFQERIEAMIRESSQYREFKTWWQEKKQN